MSSHFVEVAGTRIVLDPYRACFLEKTEHLIVSDVHLGKASHFRKHGLAVPGNIHQSDLERLSFLINKYTPKHLVFLGDLFHSDLNLEWNLFADWTQSHHSTSFTLVKGNHDILDSGVYQNTNLHILEELVIENISFTHIRHTSDRYNISGHVHPGIKLRGYARQGLSLPCFYFSKNHALIPAFGAFTGLAKIKPKKGDQVFAIAEDEIINLVG